MPNIQSAKKNLRKSTKRRERNVAALSKVKTLLKKFRDEAQKGETGAAKATYAQFCSAIDKAAKNGQLKKNNAVRRKGRAANLLRKQAAAPAAPAEPVAT